VLTCSKMKDAEQPDTKVYDLTSVHIRTDSDGDDVNSLCLNSVGRQLNDDDEALPKANRMSSNHQALWQAVRSRTQAGDPTTKAIIIDDLKAQEINVNHFSRWLTKLIEDGHLHLENDTILIGCKGGDKSG